MQQNGLADTHALQAYFNQKLEKILEKHQRQMVGWDEIYHPSLPRSIVIQSWQGQDSLGASARGRLSGHSLHRFLSRSAAKHCLSLPQ